MRNTLSKNRINILIEKYIIDLYPMVMDVCVTTTEVRKVKWSGNPKNDYDFMDVHVIRVKFVKSKLTDSPSDILRLIRNDVKRMFDIGINLHCSGWTII